MLITIKMINVGDGDAIICHLNKEGQDFILLIDGGHKADTKNVIGELDKFLKKTNKKGPDCVICTHYDADHIGGIIGVVKHYRENIRKVFMHKTTIPHEEIVKLQDIEKNSRGTLLNKENTLKEFEITPNNGMDSVLESVLQEIELLNIIEDIGTLNCEEPIAGIPIDKEWPEIEIIGPTKEYYQFLFPDKFSIKEVIEEELNFSKSERKNYFKKYEFKGPCDYVQNKPKSSLTNPNLNSVVIMITVEEKKFLFTGDAGIPSFEAIPDYGNILKGVHWLKVPHHASINNINEDLISLFNPKHAFVSGNRHISSDVVKCLASKGAEVLQTNQRGNLDFVYP